MDGKTDRPDSQRPQIDKNQHPTLLEPRHQHHSTPLHVLRIPTPTGCLLLHRELRPEIWLVSDDVQIRGLCQDERVRGKIRMAPERVWSRRRDVSPSQGGFCEREPRGGWRGEVAEHVVQRLA